MSNFKRLEGERFGKLTVMSRAENNSTGQSYWNCICDCGNQKQIRGGHLTSGNIVSCGCHAREKSTKHGMSKSPEYKAYYNMIKRCYYENDNRYSDYGGRGIKVCPRWLSSFENFVTDMGAKPSKKHSIDRIDVDGDYSPDNCRWATVEEQERNKRTRDDNRTGVRGVILSRDGESYVAQIYHEGKTIRLGSFKSLDDAAVARKAAERKYWKG